MKKTLVPIMLAGLSIGLATASMFNEVTYKNSKADNGITFNESDHYYVCHDYTSFITINDANIEEIIVDSTDSTVASFDENTNILSCLKYGSATLTVYNYDTFDEIDTIDINVEFEDKINGNTNEFYVLDQGTLTIPNSNPSVYTYVNGGGAVEDDSSRKVATFSNLRLSGSNLLVDYEFEDQTSDYLYFDVIFDEDGSFANYIEKRYYFKAIALPEELAAAISFGEDYIDNACGGVDAELWELVELEYDDLVSVYPGAVTYLRSATYELSGSGNETVVTKTGSTHYLLALYMSQYDFMVTAYSLNNFIGRSISPSQTTIVANQNNDSAVVYAVVLSTIALISIGGFFFLRKKKEQ